MAAISAPSFDVTGENVSTGESHHLEFPCSATLGKRSRTPTALSIWAESRQPKCHEPERNRHGQKTWYCKRCSYSQAAHNTVRSHLRDKHCIWIAEQQTAKKLGQDIAIDRLFKQQAVRQEGHDIQQDWRLRAAIHEEAYNQALVSLITVHSLPFSLVEWPEWYAVLHTVNRMAPATVTQSRGQVLRLLEASFSSHREALACNIAASVTQIHFITDTRSSPSQHALLAIVAHFINDDRIFTEVIHSYGMRDKIGYFTLDNAFNNDTMLRALVNTFSFNPAHRRLRCHGHIINLAMQTFLFGKNKDASDETMRHVTMLSRREHDGVGRRAETAQSWRQHGPLEILHNLVVWIRSSMQRYQAFVQAAGRMIPQDNSTGWNS
ncbi:restless-like transposase [Beauveria bassiana ARSEF 2860]|uniref:Restless-like transposase n=1 Tax=Beauveria bassiana (strain ARSEF 2860) TaxID=655819 RepID=J5J1Q7_BEAB2|nr:restless-like transposase [Beauveria bassiana ARSEF 2860]EJP60823.1 restless-like transposase [Beauveria bassiana ARSEF 2860]